MLDETLELKICVCVCVCVCLRARARSVAQCVGLFATPWTVVHQAPLSMAFPRQEDWSRYPFPSLGDLPDPGIKLTSPGLAPGFFTFEPPSLSIPLCLTLWFC